MESYDVLLFAFGHLQEVCAVYWPADFHPWSAIFLADYLRGTLPVSDFLATFSMAGSDYIALGECILEQRK